MSIITERLRELAIRNETGLITYMTGGDPDMNSSRGVLLSMAKAGADIIEVGLPFSDPVADGPVIQAASNRALVGSATARGILQMIADARQEVSVPIVIMSYYNPILQFGLQEFCVQAQASGVSGMIIPDLPWEESEMLRIYADDNGLDLIPMVAPTTTQERMENICSSARGFIYCVSVAGVTGVREHIKTDLDSLSSRVRRYTDLPLAIGFGVSGPGPAREMAPFYDAVIVGSALVELIAEQKYEEMAELTADIKAALR
ncbi:tryptophan synthase alpha chain [hydrocarbon metagenome]|uniref:tryptophan synthase n=1 Tax=hydrocarbon metagenome TaxID=938273 RepID=A0A0W8E641_9ZZZZ